MHMTFVLFALFVGQAAFAGCEMVYDTGAQAFVQQCDAPAAAAPLNASELLEFCGRMDDQDAQGACLSAGTTAWYPPLPPQPPSVDPVPAPETYADMLQRQRNEREDSEQARRNEAVDRRQETQEEQGKLIEANRKQLQDFRERNRAERAALALENRAQRLESREAVGYVTRDIRRENEGKRKALRQGNREERQVILRGNQHERQALRGVNQIERQVSRANDRAEQLELNQRHRNERKAR